MHYSTIAMTLLCSLPLSLAAPVEVHRSPYLFNGSAVTTQDFTSGSYRKFVSSTAVSYAYFLQVVDEHPKVLQNSRNVQLRKSQNGDYLIGVVDAESPVAAIAMTNGAIERQKIDFVQRPTPLGMYAKLGKRTSRDGGTSFLQELQFVAASSPPDNGFKFQLISRNGKYWLYHPFENFSASGFNLCKSGDGSYFQLFYQSVENDDGSQPTPIAAGCTFVALQTVLAPIDDDGPPLSL